MGTYRKYTLDVDYFKSIDSREKAYWLGFLYADGNISIRYYNDNIRAIKLEFSLQQEDTYALENFKNNIQTDIPIKTKKTKLNDREYISSRLVINNTEFCKNLINLGCIPNKTFSLEFPNELILKKDFYPDFIRGYFDGDGCVYVDKNNQILINLLGTENMLLNIKKILDENGIHTDSEVKKHNNIYTFSFHGNNNGFNFFKYIYYYETFCLLRKKEKFYKYCNINHGDYRFFQNIWCEYHPCHKTKNLEKFNCLFCYCPLNSHKDCGGNFTILPNGIKDCSMCLIPHYNYDYIINKIIKNNLELKGD